MKSENNTLKTKIIEITKNVLLRKIVRKFMYIKRKTAMKLHIAGIKVDDKTIFFSSFQGREYSCSPKAIKKTRKYIIYFRIFFYYFSNL